MGIFYLAGSLVDGAGAVMSLGIALNALFLLYFGLVHWRIFNSWKNNGLFAIILGIIGVGLGQAYNRRTIKGFIFLIIFVIIMSFAIAGYDEEEKFIPYVWFFFYVFTLFEANRDVNKAEEKAHNDNVKAKVRELLKYRDQGFEFAVDTNVLMHDVDVFTYLLEKKSIDLYVSLMVFHELDGLKKSDNHETRRNAQRAFDCIEEFQEVGKLHLLKLPKKEEIKQYGLSGSPDDIIIGTYLREIKKEGRNLLFITNDKGARIIARTVDLPLAVFQ